MVMLKGPHDITTLPHSGARDAMALQPRILPQNGAGLNSFHLGTVSGCVRFATKLAAARPSFQRTDFTHVEHCPEDAGLFVSVTLSA